MSRFACVLLSLLCVGGVKADALRMQSLKTQEIGDLTFFRVEIAAPADLVLPERPQLALDPAKTDQSPREQVRRFGQMPRLLPVGSATVFFHGPGLVKGGWLTPLVFLGRLDADKKPTRYLLDYPVKSGHRKGLAALAADAEMRTVEVRLDWSKAIAMKKPMHKRYGYLTAADDDLEAQWAEGLVWQMGALEARAPQMGFFSLAREVLGKQHRVLAPALVKIEPPNNETWLAGIYELTTGAEAITDSLALNRALKGGLDRGRRIYPVSKIPGITVPSHPWKKMLAGKKPAPDPLAHLVPEDNYYLTVQKPQALAEAMDLLERWGGNVMRSFVLHDRDHAIRQRYEKQLCLPSAELAKVITPGLLNGIALTGQDLSLREGTDITVLLDTTDPNALVKALESFVERARKEHGKRLHQGTSTYRRVQVKHITTPRREVSLHRAILGKVVVYSNSLAALQRVIDLHNNIGKALADALDFQYMRTILVHDVKREDGFVFVSDAFVRHLVSPTNRIKAQRRMAARAALTLAIHAALLSGWQTGELPTRHETMRQAAGLQANALDVPEGKAVLWDGERGQAFSEVYNTLAFNTPLVELPIDEVTSGERDEYTKFRTNYEWLWTGFFDPIGIRFKLDKDRVHIETHILPLVKTNRYSNLRRIATGLFVDDPATFIAGMLGRFVVGNKGHWLAVHIDDADKVCRALVEWDIKSDLNPSATLPGIRKVIGAIDQVPLVVTVRVKDPKEVARQFVKLREEAQAGAEEKYSETKYRDVTIHRSPGVTILPFFVWLIRKAVVFSDEDMLVLALASLADGQDKELPKAIYTTCMGNRYYLSWNEAALKRQIDAALARKKAEPAGNEVNAGLRLSTRNKATDALRAWLEWQTHRKALSSVAVWEALRRAGLDPAKPEAVRRLLGYVPISPDGTAFEIDRRLDEVRNTRHGSLSRPMLHEAPLAGSVVPALLEQLNQISVQLRFREDGVHTILTLERRRK